MTTLADALRDLDRRRTQEWEAIEVQSTRDPDEQRANATLLSCADLVCRMGIALEESHRLLSRSATSPIDDNHALAAKVEALLAELAEKVKGS